MKCYSFISLKQPSNPSFYLRGNKFGPQHSTATFKTDTQREGPLVDLALKFNGVCLQKSSSTKANKEAVIKRLHAHTPGSYAFWV